MRRLALTSFPSWANCLGMSTPRYRAEAVEEFVREQKIVTLQELKEAVGNPARCTLFRKLAQVRYLSSYSHRGMYYTLKSIPRFTAEGLWSFRSVWFSRFGNLLETAETFVQSSEAGYSARELKNILHVKTKHALTHLVRSGRLHREKIGSVYIYLSPQQTVAQQQRERRHAHPRPSLAALVVTDPDLAVQEAKAAVVLFCGLLDERQRRLYAGLESLKLGHGGDAHIASLLGMDPHTVRKGRRELISGEVNRHRVRRAGGGRLSQEKKRRES